MTGENFIHLDKCYSSFFNMRFDLDNNVNNARVQVCVRACSLEGFTFINEAQQVIWF